jgi:hypothetical protein
MTVKPTLFRISLAVALPVVLAVAGCASGQSAGGPSSRSDTSTIDNGSVIEKSGNRIVDSFEYSLGDTPENIVITDRSNDEFVATLLDNTVWWSDGHTEQVVPGSSDAVTLGVAEDAESRLYVAVRSQDQSVAGVWRRGTDGNWTRYAAVAPDVGLNGITFGADGTLFAADSVNGKILSVRPGESSFDVWLDDPALKPTSSADPVAASGVNGLKVFDNYLYASNTAQKTLLRIPLSERGFNSPELVVSGYAIDDFAIDSSGAFYLAVHPDNNVVRVDATGQHSTLGTADDGLDGPTAIAIAQSGILTTNLGFLGTKHQPAIIFLTSPVAEPVLPQPLVPA